MISAPCQSLISMANFIQNLLMDISKTQFHSLKTLILTCNKISSIEQLQFMNIPNLQRLVLCDNEISNLSSLNKCGWNSLRYINLQCNPIQRIDLSRLKILQKDRDQDNERIFRRITVRLIGHNESLAAKFLFNKIIVDAKLKMNSSSAVRKSIERKWGRFFFLCQSDEDFLEL